MSNSLGLNQEFPSIEKSNQLYERATGLIPSYSQTLAKAPSQYGNKVLPKYVDRAKGARFWDVDGNEYLDLQMALGPISLGYSYDRVDEAIKQQLSKGISFSLMHYLEVEVAELIREVVPNAESVRFSKSGADVTSAAIRVARSFTGREKVLCCGYHGWHDWYVSVTDRNKGIPENTKDLVHTFEYNNIEHLAASLDKDTACVIMEPMTFVEPKSNYLKEVKELCEKNGTLLIFDEMWTGFRLAVGGAQEYFGVKADLATFSKAIANGMPLSVLSGRADVMREFEKDVFFYTTFGGEALSLAAAQATITELREKQCLSHIHKLGTNLRDSYNELAQKLDLNFTKAIGHSARSMITFAASDKVEPLVVKSFLQQELGRMGVLWGGFNTISYSHTEEDIRFVLTAYDAALTKLKLALEQGDLRSQIKGDVLEPVFRKTTNFNTKAKC